MFESRFLGQGLGTGVDQTVSYSWVVGPGRNQPPLHEPAFVAAHVMDNDGNGRGSLGSDVEARGVARQIAVKFQRTRMSLNSNVAVMRPHIYIPGR